jgi:hypothetical protein
LAQRGDQRVRCLGGNADLRQRRGALRAHARGVAIPGAAVGAKQWEAPGVARRGKLAGSSVNREKTAKA